MIDQRVGNYRIVRKLGEGGMGVVYEGVHEQIGRRVAIKVLHPDLSRHADTVSRFLTEAKLVSKIQHPGVVYTFEYGQLPDQTAYIVMEYLEGESIAKRLKLSGGRLGASAVNLGRQIASGLAAAHAQGIVHRDLKPDNVMIVRDAEAIGGERAKILDFGIAKAQGSTDSAESGAVKTRTGALMGTPRYMSPEQCRGAGEVTGKSDVYSLGVMLYEMVAGRPPMVGEGMGELIAMHLYLAPTPLLELDPTLPIDLTQLIHSMLAKNPDERPAMSEVVKHLEQLGANRSIPPPSGLPLSQPGVERSVPPSPSWPDVVAGMLATPTTLRAAAAQVPPVEKPASRRSVASIAVAAVGLLGLATVISLQLTRRAGPAPEAAGRVATERGVGSPAATPPAPPPKVRWRITSQPAGAQVVRASDGLLLGTTPWQTESSRGDEKEALLLKLTGFVEQRLELSHSADSDRQEQLQPLPRAPAAEPRTRGKRKASSPAGASRKSASEDLSDDELRIVK